MGKPQERRIHFGLLALASVVALGLAATPRPADAFTLRLSNLDFPAGGITPEFSGVEDFSFELEFSSSFVAGAAFDNDDLVLVQYDVHGSLSTNPPTPSHFAGFGLNRTPAGEGPIVPSEWIAQGSSIAFEIASSAHLADGLQLSELVPDSNGLLFALDGREFERLDRARYHPPQLLLFANGTGILRNSNNSSGTTGTINPGTGLTVDVDFGDEYITNLSFDPSAITIVPEPGTGLLLALGLLRLASVRNRRA